MDRRSFLRASGFITVSVALHGCGGGGGGGGGLPPPAMGAGWLFPQGVAAGDPSDDGVVLWTRLVPPGSDPVASPVGAPDVSIGVQVTDADNEASMGSNAPLQGRLLIDDRLPVRAAYDWTVRNKLRGLAPDGRYYYQFIAGDVRSRIGRFRTAPAQRASVAQLRLACVTCQDWSVNHWGAFEYLAANEDVDLVVHLGDYIYETVPASLAAGQVEARHDLLVLPDGAFVSGSSGPRYALSLADYRYLYKKYRSDARLQAVHERFAMLAIWDDHEFSDDCWQDAETYDGGSYNPASGAADNPHQPLRRRAANRAWFEFMPADIRLDELPSGVDTVRLYRDLKWGSLAHLVVTDERLYRSDHAVPEALLDPGSGQPLGALGTRFLVPQARFDSFEAARMAAAGVADPLAGVSMLGDVQRAWWKSTLAASTATWKLWCNEVSLMRLQLDGTRAMAMLLALQSEATLATNITAALPATGGNVLLASAVVAAGTAGATQGVAAGAAAAIAANAGSVPAETAAAMLAGLTLAQAAVAVAAFDAAAGASGASAQTAAAAQAIAFGFIEQDVEAKGAASSFVQATGRATELAPYFARYLFDCDQWDGFDAERKALMAFVRTAGIGNLVALTGDLHCFEAGTVMEDFDVPSPQPRMVELVTAGVSSESLFAHYPDEVGPQNPEIASLIYYPLTVAIGGVGNVALRFNVFDFTLAGHPPTLDALAEQARVTLRQVLAAQGVAEAALDATTDAGLATLKADPSFAVGLLARAAQMADVAVNPWLAWVNTEAQGYSVLTVTPSRLDCVFRQVNRLVGSAAPTLNPIARSVTASVTAGSASVAIS